MNPAHLSIEHSVCQEFLALNQNLGFYKYLFSSHLPLHFIFRLFDSSGLSRLGPLLDQFPSLFLSYFLGLMIFAHPFDFCWVWMQNLLKKLSLPRLHSPDTLAYPLFRVLPPLKVLWQDENCQSPTQDNQSQLNREQEKQQILNFCHDVTKNGQQIGCLSCQLLAVRSCFNLSSSAQQPDWCSSPWENGIHEPLPPIFLFPSW